MLGKQRSSASFDGDRARSDINRLLDPSYTSSHHQTTYGAYVDAHGDLHDPDYRHFPLLQQPNHYSYSRRTTNATRPHWELVHEEASLLDDEDLLLEQETYYSKRNSFGYKSPSSSPRHYAASHRSSSPSRGLGAYPRAASGYSAAILSTDISPASWSSSSESSSPSSTCSSVLRSGSPFDAVSEKSRCRIASSLKSRRRRSAASASVSEKEGKRGKRGSRSYDDDDYLYRQEWPVAEEEEEERLTEEQEEDGRRTEHDSESVPTCTAALKKKWQGLSLSFQFGMYRAEQKLKRRILSRV